MYKFMSIFFLFTLIIGCSQETIRDTATKEAIPIVTLKDGLQAVSYFSDGMARSKSELVSNIWGNPVIDPHYYDQKNISRGDIVYYKTPDFTKKNPRLNPSEYSISRIVGLPGESIKAIDGQLYINGSRLDAFYGHIYLKDENKEITEFKEITIPDDSYFVRGDNWQRSIDSTIFGPLPKENINGKVVGVTGKLSEEENK